MSDIKKILSTVDNSINGFMGKVPAVEKAMYEEILKLTKQLIIVTGKQIGRAHV